MDDLEIAVHAAGELLVNEKAQIKALLARGLTLEQIAPLYFADDLPEKKIKKQLLSRLHRYSIPHGTCVECGAPKPAMNRLYCSSICKNKALRTVIRAGWHTQAHAFAA